MNKKAKNLLLQTLNKTFLTTMDLSERYSYKAKLKWNPKVEDYFIKAYGADHFSRISDALTHPSCYSCIRVNSLKTTSGAVIEKLSAVLEEYSLHNGANERSTSPKGFHDLAKEPLELSDCAEPQMKYVRKSILSKCEIPGLDYVIFAKGSGPHAIDYGYEEGKPPKEVLVSRKCAEAVLRGAQVFVPGVLACSAHVEKGDLVAVSVALEQPGADGGWGTHITRGTVLQGSQTGKNSLVIDLGFISYMPVETERFTHNDDSTEINLHPSTSLLLYLNMSCSLQEY